MFLGFTEKSDFQEGEGSWKTNIKGRGCLKGGAGTVCRFMRSEAWQEIGSEGVDTPLHTISSQNKDCNPGQNISDKL